MSESLPPLQTSKLSRKAKIDFEPLLLQDKRFLCHDCYEPKGDFFGPEGGFSNWKVVFKS
jgi:hypothetical protein